MRPETSKAAEDIILHDELFTSDSGIIYCTGNHLLTHPPAGKIPVFKEISISSGTIGFNFEKFEAGYNYSGTNNMYLRVYAGRGADRVELWTFGRTDAGYSTPSGDYTINDNQATFEYHSGAQWGARRGWTLNYWKE